MVDTGVKEDAEHIAVSLAILRDGPIDLIRSNNPLDCLGSPCPGGCNNPSGSRRCAQTHSGCLIPQQPVRKLFLRSAHLPVSPASLRPCSCSPDRFPSMERPHRQAHIESWGCVMELKPTTHLYGITQIGLYCFSFYILS